MGATARGTLVLEEIGRRRGCLVKGGTVDLSKTAGILLTDIRSGKLGLLSMEKPENTLSSDPSSAG